MASQRSLIAHYLTMAVSRDPVSWQGLSCYNRFGQKTNKSFGTDDAPILTLTAGQDASLDSIEAVHRTSQTRTGGIYGPGVKTQR